MRLVIFLLILKASRGDRRCAPVRDIRLSTRKLQKLGIGKMSGVAIATLLVNPSVNLAIGHQQPPETSSPSHSQRWVTSKRSGINPGTHPDTDHSTPAACPRALPDLTNWMLQDLPSYANRIRQRSWSTAQRQSNREWMVSTMVLAGKPEFEPLPASAFGSSQAQFPSQLQQVFFTTLERDYPAGKSALPIISHSYHWLFLTQGSQGWEFVQMMTRIGKSVSAQTALPPRDSSNGAIAQGIRLWLRDCQAGALQSKPPLSKTKAEPSSGKKRFK